MLPSESTATSPDDAPARWAREVRDFLLGRVQKQISTERLTKGATTMLEPPPVFRWWIFEGKRYSGVPGRLADAGEWLARQAMHLLETFNPQVRFSSRPEGQVDWARTLSLGPRWPVNEFALASSGLGIEEAEREALLGWVSWIVREWHEYTGKVDVRPRSGWQILDAWVKARASQADGTASREALRRWAQLSHRARWPFLRNIVSESLRAALEPQDLDQLPLPADRAGLFELLCLVRVAKTLVPQPKTIRWFDAHFENRAFVDGLVLAYQPTLERDQVLACDELAGSLRTAVQRFGVGVPQRMDGWIQIDGTGTGFGGIIIEAKSGQQDLAATLPQMKIYRSAVRRRSANERYLLWGVIENPQQGITEDALECVTEMARGQEDVWIFSGADDIAACAMRLGWTVSILDGDELARTQDRSRP